MTETTSVNGPGDDAGSFERWVQPHWSAMAGLARYSADRSDWEDVLQDALSSAWRKRAQFDAERGTARNWLLAIVADQAYKSWRRLRPVTELVDQPAPGHDPAGALDLDRAVAELSQRQQLAVYLHYYLGLPIADLAAVMACSEGTVKSTLSDARRRLRSQLGEDYR